MPTPLLEIPPSPPPPRKAWTRSECDEMEALGLFDQKRFELVQAELINKMGESLPHVRALTILRVWLELVFGGLCVITHAPIDVAAEDNPINEPQPDIIVLGLIVHRQPERSRYQSVIAYAEPDTVTPLDVPGHAFAVATALPEVQSSNPES